MYAALVKDKQGGGMWIQQNVAKDYKKNKTQASFLIIAGEITGGSKLSMGL